MKSPRTAAMTASATALLAVSLVGCSSADGSTTDSTTSETTAEAITDATDESAETTETTSASGAITMADLEAEGVADLFTQAEYTDDATGLTLPYNVYLPEDYDASQEYPVVVYIADSSLVGQEVTAPLSQYGALIWASEEQQASEQTIVVVPEYPEIILDDHGSYTMTDYVELTARWIESVEEEYSVDTDRVYATGQSMGCMTLMYLAAQDPDLFAAELFVSGQWDPSTLTGLAEETFLYIAAGGDENASGGQEDVESILDDAGVAYSAAEWDATWTEEEFDAAAAELFAENDTNAFVTFTEGTVFEVADSSTNGQNSEHMASFEPAYMIDAAREWLLAQSAS